MRLAVIVSLFYFVENAPPQQTVFDQKQSGDYNIQLHLKDFQIVALLSDESLGSLGDYDYNYDYSDFTVKPGNSTAKPTEKPSTPKPTDKPSPKPTTGRTTIKDQEKITTSTEKEVLTTLRTLEAPDRIKVQILEMPFSQSIPLADGSDNQQDEIVNYRKCGAGFTRDKRGKCRRVMRRPPFDISRLASTLAAKFRHVSAADNLKD